MTTVRDRDEAPEALRVEVTRDRRGARVTVRGELDIATKPVLERALIEQARIGGPVVLHLRELALIDATGVDLLLRTNADARRDGSELQLIPGQSVRRLLDLCASQRNSRTSIPSPIDPH